MLLQLCVFIAGMILLIKGADWLVEGASSLARRIGTSDLVIGLTIVSFGTSSPELIVNIIASIQGSADIAIGNIVGSNISNTLLILGVTAIIAPLAVQRSTVLKEIPFCFLAASVLFLLANDMLLNGHHINGLSQSDGYVLLAFFVIFLYYTFGMKRIENGHTKATKSVFLAVFLILIGLGGLLGGGKLAVDAAIKIAQIFGLSEALIGLTVVAIGTSLPELAASAVAAHKGKADIAVGNIIGSNIFNILWILGISAAIKPIPFQHALNIDLIVVAASTLLLFFLIHNGTAHHRILLWWRQHKDYIIHRSEGVVLLTCYAAYIVYVGWRG